MKSAFALSILPLLLAVSLDSASAQPPHKLQRPAPKAKSLATGGVETNTPQEPPSKDSSRAAGWNGNYVGVNAGTGFGATAGTNVVVPFGSDSDK
jgi:hypothetical protein